MLKVENIDIYGFDTAVRGMRNSFSNWDMSDSTFEVVDGVQNITIGDRDLDLMKRLVKAGVSHRTFMRIIQTSMDITAPLYWWGEMDRYTVGKTQISCSFMHTGVSKPFEITDFSVHDERVYEILSDLESKQYTFGYPYETEEYKIYTTVNGREIEVYRNGKIVEREFTLTDSMGRTRTFQKHEFVPNKKKFSEYLTFRCGGERWCVHKLVATVWIDNPHNYNTVNHKDGNKANNSVENLEWCSLSDNIRDGFNTGLYERGKSFHAKYKKWKNGHIGDIARSEMMYSEIRNDRLRYNMTCKEIANKYNISERKANNIVSSEPHSEAELFLLCYTWEGVLGTLNALRDVYKQTHDNKIFQQIRCLLPAGWNLRRTVLMSYEVVLKIIRERTGHKLDEWNTFIEALMHLPLIEDLLS